MELQLTNIYQDVEKAKAYQEKINLIADVNKYRRFYKGDQWSVPTKDNKNFPRPVFNITRMIVENKASAIAGNPIQIKYFSQIDNDEGRYFNEFLQTILKRLDFNGKLYKATLRSLVDKAAILHFYWDEDITDDSGKTVGGLNAEIVKITDVYFSDYQEHDIQKQRHIIIESRQPYKYVKSICQDEKERAKIIPDELDSKNFDEINPEIDESSLVTMYTKYFRDEDGEVKFQKATKHAIVTEEEFMNINKRSIDEEIEEDIDIDEDIKNQYVEEDVTKLSIDHSVSKNKKKVNKRVFKYYPLEILVMNPDDESIYGTSEVKDLINVQRSINAANAFSLLTLQNSGAPKLVAKKGALKGQEVTNEVGEVLIDHTPIGQQGFYTLQQQPSVAGALQLAPQMLDFIRTITNTSEIITGDKINTNVSGTAIAQAQAQAKHRIKLQENQLFDFVKKCVKIIEQFQKLYYVEDTFMYKANLKEKLAALSSKTEMPNYFTRQFNSIDYEDKEFSVEIEVGYGTQYSESLEITMLDQLLAAQYIDFDTYVDLCPQSVMPFKSQLKEKIKIKQQTELQQLKIENLQNKQQLEQMSQYSKQQEKALQDAMKQLDRETAYRKQATSEAEAKIKILQQENQDLTNKINEFTKLLTNISLSAQAKRQPNQGANTK